MPDVFDADGLQADGEGVGFEEDRQGFEAEFAVDLRGSEVRACEGCCCGGVAVVGWVDAGEREGSFVG